MSLRTLSGHTLRVALGLVACTGVASAYPVNPWGVVTPAKTFVLNPFLYVSRGPVFSPFLYGAYGFNDSIDIIAGAGASVGGGASSFDGVVAYPRYFFNESMGVALYAAAGGGEVGVGPEFHGVFGGDSSFQFTLNAGYHFAMGDGYSYSDIVVYAAPEYYFSDQLSVFVEVNPTITMDGGEMYTGVHVVPGVGFALDPEQVHSFSVGLHLPVVETISDNPDPVNNGYLGVWYATSFGGE